MENIFLTLDVLVKSSRGSQAFSVPRALSVSFLFFMVALGQKIPNVSFVR